MDTAADWLANGLHMRPDAAYARVRTACELDQFPGLEGEVHAGEVSPEATTVIVPTLRRVRYLGPPRNGACGVSWGRST